MPLKTEPIIFFGNERLSTGLATIEPKVLPMLIDEGYAIKAVIIQQAANNNSGRGLEVAEKAKEHGIPVYSNPTDHDLINCIKQIQPALGILIAFGRIISPDVLNLFPKAIVNLHPSLLPQYRGSTPIEQAILDGSKSTGASLMQLSSKMDAGAVFTQEQITLTGSDTKAELADKLLLLGATMLRQNLPAILDGSLKPTAQSESAATYSSRIKKGDGLIEPNQTASELDKVVRAYSGWPGTYLQSNNETVIILQAKAITDNHLNFVGQLVRNSDKLLLPTRQGSLEITHLQRAGRKPISARDYINSHPNLIKV